MGRWLDLWRMERFYISHEFHRGLHYRNVFDTAGVKHCIRLHTSSPVSKLTNYGCRSNEHGTYLSLSGQLVPIVTRASVTYIAVRRMQFSLDNVGFMQLIYGSTGCSYVVHPPQIALVIPFPFTAAEP